MARPPIRLVILATLVVAGCGGDEDGLARQPVSGTVTLDGQPLIRGTIQFQPSKGGATPALVAIADGRYSIPRAEGLVPGSYKVLISSREETAPAKTGPDDMPGITTGPPPKELIPGKYNVKSDLAAEVKADASNTFDFPLKTK